MSTTKVQYLTDCQNLLIKIKLNAEVLMPQCFFLENDKQQHIRFLKNKTSQDKNTRF